MSFLSWLWPFGRKPKTTKNVQPAKPFNFGSTAGTPATGQKLPPDHRRDTTPLAVPYRQHDSTTTAILLADPGSPIHHTPSYTPSHSPSYDGGSHSSHSHCDTGSFSGGFDGGGGGCDGGGGGGH